jgi:L-2-hydroxyglutarate oxidase
LPSDAIVSGGAGVRAQAVTRGGELVDDFQFADGKNCVNVINAPSPAATSSLAIASLVAKRILDRQ